jgi:hypothetical protein
MRNLISLLPVSVAVVLLCGCGRTESYREDVVETESAAPQPVEKEVAPAKPMDPDRLVPQTPPEQTKPAEATPSERQPTAPETPNEPAQSLPGLAQMRKDLDTIMAQLKTAIFEDRDPFAAQEIASKLGELFQTVSSADMGDPKLGDIIAKVKENYNKVIDYIGAQQISGAQRYFTEMEKHYQEWKAQMK